MGSPSARASDVYTQFAKQEGMTQESITKIFNITQSAISHAQLSSPEEERRSRGRPRYLDDGEAQSLFSWAKRMILNYRAPSVDEIRKQALSIKRILNADFRDLPSKRWVKRWIKGNELVLKKL